MATLTFSLRLASVFVALVVFQVAVARFSLQREAKRRWQHALTGHALVQVSYYLPLWFSVMGVVLAAAGIWYLRRFQSELFLRMIGPLLRPEELEQGKLPGAFYFLVGTALAAMIFPTPIARYAVECLSIADPMAAWIGQTIPSGKVIQSQLLKSSASWTGTLACFGTAWIIGCIMLWPETKIATITLGAAACAISEALPIVNDNISIPIGTATVVTFYDYLMEHIVYNQRFV